MPSLSSESAGRPKGRRQIVTYNVTGQPRYEYIPLPSDAFLNPLEGDDFAQGERHERDVLRLFRILQFAHRYSGRLTVLKSVKVRWKIPGLAQPVPDIVVVPNLTEPHQTRTVLDLEAEGITPSFVLEVTSPELAHFDLEDKPLVYAAAGVEEYFVLDAHVDQKDNRVRYTFYGYRLASGRYVPVAQDADGYLASSINRVDFRVVPSQGDYEIVDSRTRQTIDPPGLSDTEPSQARSEAEARARSILDKLDFT